VAGLLMLFMPGWQLEKGDYSRISIGEFLKYRAAFDRCD
jgi:hypothetical protein